MGWNHFVSPLGMKDILPPKGIKYVKYPGVIAVRQKFCGNSIVVLSSSVHTVPTTGSPCYRLLEKYFGQEIIFCSFTDHCVVLLSSFRLHLQPIRVIIREIQ